MPSILAAAEELPDPSTVGPGTAAFVTFLFLVVAGVLLFRSMRKQMGKVDFPEDPAPQDLAPDRRERSAP